MKRVGNENYLLMFGFIVIQLKMKLKVTPKNAYGLTKVYNIILFFYCILCSFLLVLKGVLAAASSFFASILPDFELENDVCISTDLSVKYFYFIGFA